MTDHFDFDGKPISMDEWARLFEDDEARVVARTTIAGKLISTVWLGLDHRFGLGGPPLIFETMVFGGGDMTDEYCERYSAKEEAVRGHWRAVEMVAGPFPDEEEMRAAAESVKHLISSLENDN